MDEKDVSDEEKNKALNSLMFLAKKRNSTIKACMCRWKETKELNRGKNDTLTKSLNRCNIYDSSY